MHVSRNISHKVRVDDRKEVCDDFKMVYQASSKRRHWKHVVLLRKNGKPVIQNGGIDPFERLPLTFYDFPLAIRKTIYSTNLIESFNKQIKKYSHRKEQFQNEESMERFLVSSFDTYNQKFLGRSHKGFQQAEGELEQMLSQLIEN